jgi:hypothetical protein
MNWCQAVPKLWNGLAIEPNHSPNVLKECGLLLVHGTASNYKNLAEVEDRVE